MRYRDLSALLALALSAACAAHAAQPGYPARAIRIIASSRRGTD